ncbi:hypothetical protein EJ08DRAFT_343393 [Tothia fuscella]|uniref:Uncharacterized protein n=1 Tax=Tothia fuscella TaxID=1048955 RepID=A0A9P4P263_9PEZI|nr:hypothetical protein EJ08DRAFT_343393 [Tothia fuscella]
MSSISSTTMLNTKPASKYIRGGRGGAGNYLKAPEPVTSSNSSVYSTTSTSSRQSSVYSTGVGGFGNHHSTAPGLFRAFCNEVSKKRAMIKPDPVHHFGVGGAGNVKN